MAAWTVGKSEEWESAKPPDWEWLRLAAVRKDDAKAADTHMMQIVAIRNLFIFELFLIVY